MMKIKETLEQRNDKYGSFEINSDLTWALYEIIEKSPKYFELSRQHKISIMFIFHKISRMVSGDVNYIDNVHDIIGYATLLENYLKDLNCNGKLDRNT